MPELPSHASPYYAPRPLADQQIAHLSLSHGDDNQNDTHDRRPPLTLLSPAFTPPSTPGTETPSAQRDLRSVPVDTATRRSPRLVESLPEVNCVVRARIPTVTGAEMFLHLYTNNTDNKEHLAIVFGSNIRSKSLDAPRPGETEMDRMIRGAYVGKLHPGRTSSRYDTEDYSTSPQDSKKLQQPQEASVSAAPALVRIHSECYTGETAWSARCDCGEQLDEAARLMSLPESPGGVIVYLRQEGRGIGLGEKLKAYNLQDLGSDTVEATLLLRHPADARSYGLATAMLLDLGFGALPSASASALPRSSSGGIKLLTNNPDKVRAVEGPNREIIVRERVPMIPLAWKTGGKQGVHGKEIEGYLRTKIGRMGHMID